MTPEAHATRRNGLLIATAGGLFLSFDIPLVRLSEGGLWPVLALRSLSTFAAALLVMAVIRFILGRREAFVPGRAGLLAGLFYGLSTMAFVAAVYHTTTANVVFIVAFSPMFAALLSWIFLRESPSRSTLFAMGAMVVGVVIIVGGGLAAGHVFGDLLALLASVLIAAGLTTARASGKPMGFVPLLASAIPAAISLGFAWPEGLAMQAPAWALLDGLVLMPLAFWLLATAPRYLPAAEVGMFYLLETVLAPIWMWMIFREVPSTATLFGGTLIICALLAHSLVGLRARQAGRIAARSPTS